MSLVNPLDLQEVIRPRTLAEALAYLSRGDITPYPLAGGTGLLAGPATGIRALLDLSDLQLRYITSDDAYLHIGATATLQDVAESEHALGLADGVLAHAAFAAAPGVQRRQKTVGGTVVAGDGHDDFLVAALALDAEVVYYLPGDRDEPRVIPLAQFVSEIRHNPPYLLTELRIPIHRGSLRGRLERVSRTPRDSAIVNAAAVLTLEDEKVVRASVVVGGVGEYPIHLETVEAWLTGKALREVDAAVLEETAREAVSPPDDWRASAEYRRHVVGILVRRAILHT